MNLLFDGTLLALLLGLGLDHAFGEARRWHPLVGFGRLVQRAEHCLNNGSATARWCKGTLGVVLLMVPCCHVVVILRPEGSWQIAYDALIVYFCLGLRSLREHTSPIADALRDHERQPHDKENLFHSALPHAAAQPGSNVFPDASTNQSAQALHEARRLTARIVSRDVHAMNGSQCARAAIESLLENGNDALFATLFWYLVLGPAGAVLHRLSNTLDAMWGYHTPRYEWFGKPAARLDDGLAWIPARLTAVSYALAGNPIRALRCWRLQARHLSSPNGGPCMTAGAGSLGVSLGGACRYHGQWVQKPVFGEGPAPQAGDIYAAQQLLTRALWIWLATLGLLAAISPWLGLKGLVS